MATRAATGWDGILAPGERILWQGRPEARFDWGALISKRTIPAFLMTAFAAVWITLAFRMTADANGNAAIMHWLMPLFGLPILAKGLNMLIGSPLRAWLRLRGCHYTLTDQNAFIASDILGRKKLERYPLGPAMTPALEEGDPGSVWFALRSGPTSGWSGKGAQGDYVTAAPDVDRLGFAAIADARRVYRLLLDAISNLPASADAGPQAPPLDAVASGGAQTSPSQSGGQ